MFKLIEVVQLIRKGIRPVRAWRVSARKLNTYDWVLIGVLWVWLMYMGVSHVVTSVSAEINDLTTRARLAQQQARQAHHRANKYERIVIACLNNQDFLVDRVNRPCSVGEFK
jgi:hypothetical protein